MSVHVSYSTTRTRGYRRYTVGFARGPYIQFLIQSPNRPQRREWQALFARALASALNTLADQIDARERITPL